MSSVVSPDSPGPAAALHPKYSCMLCQKRKVRCDRQHPCSGCVRAGVACVVQAARAPYRRRNQSRAAEALLSPESGGGGSAPGRQIDGRGPSPAPACQASASKTVSAPARAPMFGQNLWTGLQEEFREPPNTETSIAEDQQVSVAGTPLPDPSALIFGGRDAPKADLRGFHPSAVDAFVLWQAFLQNVNPLSKVVYAPSVQEQVVEASRDFSSVPEDTVPLLFAVYAAAVASLSADECRIKLGEAKPALLERYLSVTQKALTAAGFMRSKSLVLLQAFTLYLLAARQVLDPQTMWILTGMAVRMGQRLGLSDADTSTGGNISPFAVQMRRRVWWQILLVDGRITQLSGQSLSFADTPDYSLPANLNDSDINPRMTETPPPVLDRPTEMIFCLARYELGRYLIAHGDKLHGAATPLAEKDRIIDELERVLEERYLRHCDPAVPLHQIARGGARSAVCKMRLMAHHPCQYPDKGRSMPQPEHDMLFATSVLMVEMLVLGYTTKGLEHFAWHIDVYFQLDAFVFMLIEVRTQPPTAPLTEKAWGLVTDVFRYRSELRTVESELYASVRQLALRAWDARELEARRRGLGPLVVPEVVQNLRVMARRALESGRLQQAQAAAGGEADRNPRPQSRDPRGDIEQGPAVSTEASESSSTAVEQAESSSGVGPYSSLLDGEDPFGWGSAGYESWEYWDELLQTAQMSQ